MIETTEVQKKKLIAKIEKLKAEKEILVLAHFYQSPEIQDVADFVGDSLMLLRKAAESKNESILFATPYFVAETAKLMFSEKKILCPDRETDCPLISGYEGFAEFIANYPDHIVIAYMKTPAWVKALSDVVCSVYNAQKIIESLPKDQKVLFAGDENFANYLRELTGRELVAWSATCEVHRAYAAQAAAELKAQHPLAMFLVHAESPKALLLQADFIGSASALLDFVKYNEYQEFMVADESGILHQMQLAEPKKTFIAAPSTAGCNDCNTCRYMKKISLQKLRNTLKQELPELAINEELATKAIKPIQRMYHISKKLNLI